jgi:hypothetical protein
MKSYELDKLVMLLSSDWFLPYWRVIGVFGDEKEKHSLHDGLREIVQQVMSGASQYWDIDFGVERVKKTHSMLDALLKKCRLPQSAVDRINRLVSGDESPIDDGTRWLLVSITEQLLDGSVPQAPALDADIKEALRQVWIDSDAVDFTELCLASRSGWDQYLRTITPDLPATLADYVSAIANQSKFEVLWGFINAKLTAKARHELLSWYRSMGHALTGEPLRLLHEA